MTLGDSLCFEDLYDMKAVYKLRDALPLNLARAVLIVPEKLPEYVAYSLISVGDPHSDYAVQMQKVCRTRHSKFLKAVGELPPDKKAWFTKDVMNPENCHALALPKAE
jgi:hypothetical protein